MKKLFKLLLKIGKYLFIGLLVVALLANLISIFKRLVLKEQLPMAFGWGSAIIISGSMEPAIHVGDLVIIHRQGSYAVGDIVTFAGNNYPITHRVMGLTPNGYITQGDANNAVDGEIDRDRIIGRVVAYVPRAGNVILFFQSTLGMLLLIAALFVILGLPNWIGKR